MLASFVRQTSIPFQFPRRSLQDHKGQPLTIFNTTGVTYIATNIAPEKSKKEHFTHIIVVPNDDKSPESLRTLTSELSQFTTDLFDIEIATLSLTWGINAGELPFLLESDGIFRCTADSSPYARFLTDIALFIALETGEVQEPGKCFSRRSVCVAPEMTCPRQKIETWRIKKLAGGLGADEKGEFVHYVKRRLGLVCPTLLVSTVLVCRNCFALYAPERMPQLGAEDAVAPLNLRTAPLRASAPADAHRPDTSVGVWRKSPSGLTCVQDIYGRSVHRARKTYITRPIPAFRQHPV
jgi:hypothetical protein